MRISFFWGNSRAARGIAFHRKYIQENVHYVDLLFLRGVNVNARLTNFKRAWIKLLTLGKVS